MRLFALVLLLIPLSACGGRWAPGYLITEDGQMVTLTDENIRATTVTTIVKQLDAQLGQHWRVDAAIAELPVYEPDNHDQNSGWMWAKATATITLIGDGQGEPPLAEEQITKAVRDYLHGKVDRPHRNLTVSTVRVVDAARFAARPAATTATAGATPATTTTPSETAVKPAVSSPPPANRRYVVQAGDTWADLSQAFYGSTQFWRHLADANQGGDLNAGRELVIPPRP